MSRYDTTDNRTKRQKIQDRLRHPSTPENEKEVCRVILKKIERKRPLRAYNEVIVHCYGCEKPIPMNEMSDDSICNNCKRINREQEEEWGRTQTVQGFNPRDLFSEKNHNDLADAFNHSVFGPPEKEKDTHKDSKEKFENSKANSTQNNCKQCNIHFNGPLSLDICETCFEIGLEKFSSVIGNNLAKKIRNYIEFMQ